MGRSESYKHLLLTRTRAIRKGVHRTLTLCANSCIKRLARATRVLVRQGLAVTTNPYRPWRENMHTEYPTTVLGLLVVALVIET